MYKFLSESENKTLFNETLAYLRSKGYIIEKLETSEYFSVCVPPTRAFFVYTKSDIIGMAYDECNRALFSKKVEVVLHG